jgi:hypothetical protein
MGTKRTIGLRAAAGAVGMGIATLALLATASPAGAILVRSVKLSPDKKLEANATVELSGNNQALTVKSKSQSAGAETRAGTDVRVSMRSPRLEEWDACCDPALRQRFVREHWRGHGHLRHQSPSDN